MEPMEPDNGENKHVISDEEFESSSMSLDTDGKRIMAEFDEKSSLLKAQFSEENRAAVESIENVKKEIKASQEKEATITQEFDEMRMRYDNIEENLRRLDEVSKRREREEQKWRKKMDKRMKKNASRLEKVRAERLQYRMEKEADNGKPDEMNNAVQELGSAAAEVGNDAPQGIEDAFKEVLYNPTEVANYDSVENLEKERKELRRLEKLKKKAIKREKVERKEKKKIEKEKRRVERKLAKMKAEKSAATENTEASKFYDEEHSGMCSIVVQNKLDHYTERNINEQPDAQSTLMCEVEDLDSVSPIEESEQDPPEGMSSQHEVLEKGESLEKPEDFVSIEEETDVRPESENEENGGSSPVFNVSSPLIRKQSGTFSFHGLQPFLNSSQNWKDCEILMNSSFEDDERRAQKDHVEVSNVCEDDLEYIEDVICGEFVISADEKNKTLTERVEASDLSDDDLDYTEDAICEDREDDSEKTEDIEVTGVCDEDCDYIEDLIWEENVSSAGVENNVQTEHIEVSTVNDYTEDVIYENWATLAADNHSVKTEDIKISSLCDKDLDYIEDVICEDGVTSAVNNHRVQTEDIELPTVNDDDIDNIEDVICEDVLTSAVDDHSVQTQDMKVSSVCEEDLDCIEDVICEKIEGDENVKTEDIEVSTVNENDLDYIEDIICEKQDEAICSPGQSQQIVSESIPKSSTTEKKDKIFDDEATVCAEGVCIQAISDVDSMLSSSDEEDYRSSKENGENDSAEDLSEDSFTSVSELISEDLSSCDPEIADFNGAMSEDEYDDTDSRDELDDQTFPCSRDGRCSSCLKAAVDSNKGDDRQSCWEHEGSVAAVVNIAEDLLQKEFSEALKTATAFPNTSQSGVSGAEARFNKETRQLKREHFDVTDELKKLHVSLEEIEEKNKSLKEIVDFTNKENEKLLDQVIAMKEEAKTIKTERESCQGELETVNHELKRLKANEEYKERELTNLRDDTEKKERQLKDMKEDLDYAQMDKKDLLYDIDLLKDKLKESEERNKDLQFQVDQLKQMAKEVKMTANWGNKEHDYSYLREEVELLKGSLDLSKHQEELSKGQLNDLKKSYTALRNENEQIARIKNELEDEHEKIMEQLKEQLASLESEISTTDREGQLAKFQKENFRITAHLSDVSEKYKQLSELQDEKENITMQLAKLEKENSTIVAELSKMSDKDKQLNGLLKQVEGLKNQNKHLQHEALVAKEQVADKITSSTEESSKEGKLSKTKQSRYKFKIKKLKKRVRQKESEIERLGRFARQTGPYARETTIWLNWLKDERTELNCVRNALKLQNERVQYLEDRERELENIKIRFKQKENELMQTQDGLKLMAETTEAFNRCVREMDNFLQYADSNTCNSDISSIIDDRDRDDFNDSANLDICHLDEDGNEELPVNSKEESVENEHSRLTVSSEKEAGHKPLSTIPEHEGMTVNSDEVGEKKQVAINSGEKEKRKGLTVHVEGEAGHKDMSLNLEEDDGHKKLIEKLEEGSKPIKAQVAHVNEILNYSLESIQYVKEALKQRQESWDQKSNVRDYEMAHLRNRVKIQDGEIESLKQYVTQLEDDSVYFIQELQGKLESSQNTLKEKEATLNEADDMLTSILACSGTRDHEFDDSMDFIEKLDATIEKLKGNPESEQRVLQEKEALLKQAETILTALFVASETSDFTQLQEKLQSTPILLKEKTEALMKAEAEIQTKASLLVTAEAKHEDTVKKLKEELKSSQITIKEKTAALEQAEAKLPSPHASLEQKHDKFVKKLQEDLKTSQSSLQKMAKALEQTEAELEMKSSLLSTAKAKYNELMDQLNTSIKDLQRDLERVQSSLKEKTEALEQANAELKIKSSLLSTAEATHDRLMAKLDGTIKDLESMKGSLNEKTNALKRTEAQLQLKASLLAAAQTEHEKLTKNRDAIVKELQRDLERTQSSLNEKSNALEKVEEQLQLKASVLATAETKHDQLTKNLDATIKRLQSDLESAQSSLNEKTDALEKSEEQLQLKVSQHDKLTKNLYATIKGLQSDLERTQSSLSEKTDALEVEVEASLQLKASRLATVETQKDELMRKIDATIKRLEIDLERSHISLKEKTDALEQAKAQLQVKALLLATMEGNHKHIVVEKDDELESTKIAIKEMKAAFEETEAKMKLKASLLSSAEAKLSLREHELEELRSGKKENDLKYETLVKSLEEEVEKTKMCLKEKTATLEKTQTDLQFKTLPLARADWKSGVIVKQLEDDLKTTQKSLKDTEDALERVELDLQSKSSLDTSLEAKVCLRENELEELKLAHKGRDLELERVSASMEDLAKLKDISDTLIAAKNKDIVSLRTRLIRKTEEIQKMKFDMAPTQDKLQLVSAELARAKNAKTKLLREVTAAVTRLENQKIAADRERSVLKKQIDNVLEDDEWKTKRIQDLKMNLKVSRIQVSKLESEKREKEECCRDYKEKTEDEIKWLKQALKASNENNAMYESRISSKKQENSELRRENQRLKTELLQKDGGEMTEDCGVHVSSRPLMVRYDSLIVKKNLR